MNLTLNVWMPQLMATDTPALPTGLVMQVWLHLGWSVVLACVGASLVERYWPGKTHRLDGRQWGVALVLALWTWVPGPYSPAYWLGLAFQAPSIVSVLLCDALLRNRLFAARTAMGLVHNAAHVPNCVSLSLAGAGVVLGWVLLLDTFALLPVQFYAWGFSPAALGLVLMAGLVPWAFASRPTAQGRSHLWVLPVAALVFVVSRLPSGNVWDAVLDPWLWLVLHLYLAPVVWRSVSTRFIGVFGRRKIR